MDTTIRAALAVALYAAFPKFSDLFLLWLRQQRLAPVGLTGPGNFEYPPLAALYWWPFSNLPTPTAAVIANAIVMGGLAVAVTWVLIRIAGDGDKGHLRMWAASPTLIFFLPINWEAAVILLMMLGVSALVREKEAQAGGWLAAGTAMKVFPGAIALPVLPLLRDNARRLRFLAVGAATGIAIYAFDMFWLRPDNWRFQFDAARIREDYEATVWAGLEWLLDLFGIDLSLSAINALALATTIVALIALTWWCYRNRPTIFEVSALAVMAFIVCNKTFKPQYLLWVLPLLALSRVARRPVLAAEIAVIVDFATYHFEAVEFLQPAAVIVRTIALLVIAWELLARYRRQPRF